MSQPDTSREAHENAASFKANHRARIFLVVKNWPGLTAGEISQAAGLDKVSVSRRLPEIEKEGHIFRDTARACTCDYCKTRQLTWQPKSMQGNLFDAEPKAWFK